MPRRRFGVTVLLLGTATRAAIDLFDILGSSVPR